MDKRTIIAFVIIGLIIIVTPHYMRWLTGDEPPPDPQVDRVDVPLTAPDTARARSAIPPQQEVTPSRAEIDSHTVSSAGAIPDEQPPYPFKARYIPVTTDRYRAVFSTRGGLLVSFQLKDYLDGRGRWLELLPPGAGGLGITLDGTSLAEREFTTPADSLTLSGTDQAELVFEVRVNGSYVRKRLLFQGNRFRIEMDVRASGGRRGGKIGLTWDGALAATEVNEEENLLYSMIVTRVGEEVEQWDVGDLGPDAALPSGTVSWVSIRSKYFLAAILPPDGRYDLNLRGSQDGPLDKDYFAEITTQHQPESFRFGVYLGPISYDILRAQNTDLTGQYQELELDEMMDYGWAIFRPVMKPITILILKAFLSLHQLVSNYGLVIIVFSILIKILVFPMTHKSLEAAAKMQELQPRMAELREKFSDNQQKLNQEMMKLYKDQKVNPLGGCLPMVLQMPVLISLFNVFRGAIELRQSEFVLWITDLSQPDRLMVSGFEVHVLPLLMAISMFYQQKRTMKDPKQAALVYIMPVFMTWIFWSMSSGLVLYWTMFQVLTVAQQLIMESTKKVFAKD